MQSDRINRSTRLFVGLFLLAGCANLLTRADNLLFGSVMFTVNFAIYIGLIIFWMQSVKERLLPTRARSYILAAAFLMLTYLLLRVYKYRIANTAVLIRYTSYVYYVPMMLIPALFLMTCICIRRGENAKGKEKLLLFPAAILSLIVLTNDLHRFVYIPKVPRAEFIVLSGTYAYGPGFYLLYVWMLAAILAGVALLFSATRKKSKQGLLQLLAIFMIWFGMALFTERVLSLPNLKRPYSTPEIHIFGMLAVFEVCIRLRLLPHNENYAGFFESMQIPALITDRAFTPVFTTAEPLKAGRDDLQRSLSDTVYPAEDIRLHGHAIRAGYIFWTTDERELRRMNDRLLDANETLDTENTLIKAENRQREELAHMDFQNRIYRQISEELYPTQKKIEELLSAMQPGTESYLRDMKLVCVLNAYVKRATNLMLLAAEADTVESRELLLALQESARYLTYYGIKAEAMGDTAQPIRADMLFPFYKTFEELIEKLLSDITYLTATFSEDGIRLALDLKALPSLPKTTLPVSAFLDDDLVYLTVSGGEGGAV
ncbi:MAG: hypothetical protein IJ240_03185 [Clostridia bacterium]|nr:hypothetical protein [Clostridia bacterium]